MAKINNVGLNTTHKIANPFKTSRNSTTNPFKYSNFEGNTLQFADVFEGFENKKTSLKSKIISASVVGSMTKLRSAFEPIANFVNRVRTSLSDAIDNMKHIRGMKFVSESLNSDIVDIRKGISGSLTNVRHSIGDSLTNVKEGLSDRMSYLNKDISEVGEDLKNLGKGLTEKLPMPSFDVTGLRKGMSEKWGLLVNKIHHNRITKDTPVADLRTMWIDINALESEAA